uniref:xylose isomerase n=1 Tax=Zea mays TaxID=4577 RepID=A0A804N7G3_MAIZE
MDQWSEIPSDVESFSEGKSYLSNEELSDVDSANVVVMDKYMDSLLSDRRNLPCASSSVRQDSVRRKPTSSADYSHRPLQPTPPASLSKKESWDVIEDSELKCLMTFTEKMVLTVFRDLTILWMTKSLMDDIHGWGVLFDGRVGYKTITVYIWNGEEPKPNKGHLAWADAFVITADSISMLSEACSTGLILKNVASLFMNKDSLKVEADTRLGELIKSVSGAAHGGCQVSSKGQKCQPCGRAAWARGEVQAAAVRACKEPGRQQPCENSQGIHYQGMELKDTPAPLEKRRESTNVEDMFLAHIFGMDTLARGLHNVVKLIEMIFSAKRYQSFDSEIGALIEDGKGDFEMLKKKVLECSALFHPASRN